MDLLIIGAGLSGATIANKAAKAGKKVLILEKRDYIGGNVYDFNIDNVLVHRYGPHIFHTNDEEVNTFMEEFWELNGFKNRVEAKVQDKFIPLPFNFVAIDRFWPENNEEIKEKLIKKYGKDQRVGIAELLKQEDEQLKEVAEFVYKNIFENYTTKMWGTSPEDIDKSVLARVPVIIGYGNTYFSDKYEGLPKDGYTQTIKNMLNHENIEIRTSVNAKEVLEFKETKIFMDSLEVSCPIIYCGPIDELFDYKFGMLNYRSLDIQFESRKMDKYQNVAVVNYPAHPEMTRITEYKNMTKQVVEGITVLSKEYPGAYDVKSERFGTPYYPMMTDESKEQYDKYEELIKQYPVLIPLGRLATYKYLNMDMAIKIALNKWEDIKGDL